MTYPSRVAPADIVGRVMGPDHCGGYLVATAAEPVMDLATGQERTHVSLRPVPPDETRGYRDKFGQWWLPLE